MTQKWGESATVGRKAHKSKGSKVQQQEGAKQNIPFNLGKLSFAIMRSLLSRMRSVVVVAATAGGGVDGLRLPLRAAVARRGATGTVVEGMFDSEEELVVLL